MPRPGELRARILEVIDRGASHPLADAEFNDLALAIFAHQYARNQPYRAYCDSRGSSPEQVRSWLEIPAVPTDAFKAATLLCGDPADAVALFRTSGTTAGRERRGSHVFLDLRIYEAALLQGFRHSLLPDGARLPILSLVPRGADQPDSSLSHMVDTVIEELGGPGSGWFVAPDSGLDVERLRTTLDRTASERDPVLLVGTSLAFAHLFEALEAGGIHFDLPPGSRAMDTGGSKGLARELSRAELLHRFHDVLGVSEHLVVNEYGMTEMSSQLYAAGRAMHRGPGWLRTRAVDPESLVPLRDGEVGVLRHWDLANMDSVAVLQTADLGRVAGEEIELLGRARGAEARGCSIAMDELLGAISASPPAEDERPLRGS